jgi:hypothetical protein
MQAPSQEKCPISMRGVMRRMKCAEAFWVACRHPKINVYANAKTALSAKEMKRYPADRSGETVACGREWSGP